MTTTQTERMTDAWRSYLRSRCARLQRVHRDESGTISIMTVFAMLMFTMLLIMVTNVARHADDKIRMQNAADASAQSGTVVLARGMNSIAFTNHLLSEVFALTAYMREAERGEEGVAALVPEILEEWRQAAQAFEQAGAASGHSKFERLGSALQQKIPLETAVKDDFVEMAVEHSRLTKPVFEYILGGPDWSGSPGIGATAAPPDPLGGFIPRFQRAVILHTPLVSHMAANEMAERHGRRTQNQHGNMPMEGRMWRTDVQMLGIGSVSESDPLTRTLPVIDPSPAGPDNSIALIPAPYDADGRTYFEIALQRRRQLAEHYLKLWISDWMEEYFDFGDDNDDFVLHGDDDFSEGMTTAKMTNMLNLYRAATCEHLNTLLNEEYPFTNMPLMIRSQPVGTTGPATLEREYTFVGVAYWPHLEEMAPGVFRNPLKLTDGPGGPGAVTFTQTSLYMPKPRLVKRDGSWVIWIWREDPATGLGQWLPYPHRDWPPAWDTFSQNWMARIQPGVSESIVPILQQSPGSSNSSVQPPLLNGVTIDEIRAVNGH